MSSRGLDARPVDQSELRAMLDKHQIRNLIERYCRGIDRQHWDDVRDCYHPDAIHHHGMFVGSAQEFIDYVSPHIATMQGTLHVVANMNVELEGDQAVAETYAIAFHRVASSKSGSTDQTVWYRYLDSLQWRDRGGWRIARREVVYDWSRIDAVGREWRFGPEYLRARRDDTDPSFDHLAMKRLTQDRRGEAAE